MSHGGHEIDTSNKKIGLLIATLALLLAFSEMGNKQGENDALAKNVEASNLWSFFQAKTIRRTTMQTAAETLKAQLPAVSDPTARSAMEAQIRKWNDTATRYETEPETGEGRKELMVRAKAAEAARDLSKARGEVFEIASAFLQIGIVMASAAVITGLMMLAFCAGGLGLFGLILMGIALWNPMILPFIH
jgi:hypothetical protein